MSIVNYAYDDDGAAFAIRCNECPTEGPDFASTADAERNWEEDGNEIFGSGRHLCQECAHPNPAMERVTERHNDNVMRGLFARGGL